METVFLSYSHKDGKHADAIASILQELDIPFFRDEINIHWGEDVNVEVHTGLNNCFAILVVLSPASIRSQWVAYEIGYARGRQKKILPFLTDPNIEVPDFISKLNFISKLDDLKKYFGSSKRIKGLLKPKEIPIEDIEKAYIDWWERENENRTDITIEFERLKFLVDRKVFSPNVSLTYSTYFTSRFLHDMGDKTVLDIGTGCGILAILAAKRGAKKVVAVDIDNAAVKNANYNVRRHRQGKKVRVYQGDLFTVQRHILAEEKFDVIIANLPIAFYATAWSHLKENFNSLIRRWALELNKHLKPTGEAYLAWASFGDQDLIHDALSEANLSYKEWTEKTFGATWQIFQIKLNSK